MFASTASLFTAV